MIDLDDMEEIAEQNDPHGNGSTRDRFGRGSKRTRVGGVQVMNPSKGAFLRGAQAHSLTCRRKIKITLPGDDK